jgi:hypothetical protein
MVPDWQAEAYQCLKVLGLKHPTLHQALERLFHPMRREPICYKGMTSARQLK